MIDSGGFALMARPDPTWTVRKVADLIGRIDADIFVTLDYPPRFTDTRLERRRKIVGSMDNFKRLSDIFPKKVIMPVVHGRTIDEIELSLELIIKRQKKS